MQENEEALADAEALSWQVTEIVLTLCFDGVGCFSMFSTNSVLFIYHIKFDMKASFPGPEHRLGKWVKGGCTKYSSMSC